MALGSIAAESNKSRLVAGTIVGVALGSTNATTLLTVVGIAAKRHYITSLSGSFNPFAADGSEVNLTLTFDATVVGRWSVRECIHLGFPAPIQCPLEEGAGQGDIKAQLTAGGVGTAGNVVLTYFTV